MKGDFVHFTVVCQKKREPGVSKEERAKCGVSFILHKKYKKHISWDQINERILLVEMELKNYPVVVVAVYGPNDDAPASSDKFYDELTRLLDRFSIRKEIFLMGEQEAEQMIL
ncbi:hypothetical protein HHI36_017449 [Cryptolaemus montrouzieri]|uniref:Uncharacterized protein n=1 Tax=Cryptolaemus montrouzieri TaxID=559131 RepID=A0ABD2NNB8_9CUCU